MIFRYALELCGVAFLSRVALIVGTALWGYDNGVGVAIVSTILVIFFAIANEVKETQ